MKILVTDLDKSAVAQQCCFLFRSYVVQMKSQPFVTKQQLLTWNTNKNASCTQSLSDRIFASQMNRKNLLYMCIVYIYEIKSTA